MYSLNEWYIERAYRVIGNKTPLCFDCGCLCASVCCKGNESDSMFLFPGEEKRFIDNPSFRCRKENGVYYVTCNGNCNRDERPLACRIYPLFPYVSEKNGKCHIAVQKNIRALENCPLSTEQIDRDFIKTVRLLARNLVRDEDCRRFLLSETEKMLDFGFFR